MTPVNQKRIKRKPMGEINVVPYIDVMLVLLVIFMITAPLLTQGVNVDLPQASAEPIEAEAKEPLIVTVNAEGDYYLNVGEDTDSPIENDAMVKLVAAVLRNQPGTPVLIRGDGRVRYERVVFAMSLLQRAGAPSVGLITETPTKQTRKSRRKTRDSRKNNKSSKS
ncbi:MAG: protein TolR [Thiohalomonadales bacterium]